MLRRRCALWFTVLALALPSLGCSISLDEILAIQEGSQLSLAFVGLAGHPPNPTESDPDILTLSGGAVVRLDISLSVFDYLDGAADGEIEVLDVLIAVPGYAVFGNRSLFTGDLCIVLNDAGQSGGSFEYHIAQSRADFDAVLDTIGLPGSREFAAFLPGGAIPFPFQLDASTDFTPLDAVGLVSGTGTLEIVQDVDDFVVFPLRFGETVISFLFHLTGTIGMETSDIFPTPPIVLSCLDRLAGQGV